MLRMKFSLAALRTYGSFTSKFRNRETFPLKIVLRAAFHLVTFVTFASIMQPCQMSSLTDSTEMVVVAENAESENFELFLKRLRGVLSDDDIDLDDDECRQRGKPWNSYHKVSGYPRIIVSPSTTEQVAIRHWQSCSHSS